MTDDGRNESELKRADRNLTEMLQGLRSITFGIQVVFGFLFTVAFSAGRNSMSDGDRILYVCVLATTGVSLACLGAPAAHHRLVFQQSRKPQLVVLANQLILVGMVLAVVGLSGAVALVTDVLYGAAIATAVGVGFGAVFATIWFVLPLVVLRRPGR